VSIGGHRVEDSLDRLAEIEASFRDLARSREREAVFRVVGRWLVEEGHLRTLLRGSLARALGRTPRVPVVGDLKPAPLALAAISGPRVRSRSGADAVCFKHDVRAFYLGGRAVTLKMANPATRGIALQDEIRARRSIGKATGVALPRFIAGAPDATPPYLWEEVVFGRRPDPARDRAQFLERLLPRILDFYEGCGVRYVIASDFLDLDRLAADALEAAGEMSWSGEWVDRELFRARAVGCCADSDELVVVGRGHGDLSSGNILITADDGVCLVDWARSREQILIQDLQKLCQEYPGCWEGALARMESWRPPAIAPDRVMPWEQQALLGNLLHIQFFSRLRRRNADLGRKWVDQLERILAKEFAAATRLIGEGRL
jgi:hypothetical protein